MTNAELADAIDATWRLLQRTNTASDLRAPTFAHYTGLLAEQARRAAERPAVFVPTCWTDAPTMPADATITITNTGSAG